MERSIGGSNNSTLKHPTSKTTSSKSKGKQKAKDQHNLTWVGEGGVGIGGFSVNLLGNDSSNLPETKNERIKRVKALEERMS